VTSPNQKNLRNLPAVERMLNRPEVFPAINEHGRAAVTQWVRGILADLRGGLHGELLEDPSQIELQVIEILHEMTARADSERLQQVINATGIVIHTNLGRAPLAPAAVKALLTAVSCTNIEVELSSGRRGNRGAAVETLCRDLTGAEAAIVVNNCAAATLLTLQTLAAGRRVVISRGQLIEIGGSFRLPEIFRQAGVELCEVGTTNRTRLSDYANAIGPDAAALLRVHPSNYRISGFCESASIAELAELAKAQGLLAIDDVGSGCLYDLSRYGLPDEPIVGDSLRAGADLVLFSGDKLLGGPQCGIIVGRADLVEQLRSNPLARAIRVDKLTLAALQGTLETHRTGRALTEIPVLRQLTLPAEEIRVRAERLLERLTAHTPVANRYSLQAVQSASGGGALPEQTLPSWAIAIAAAQPDDVSKKLRLGTPSVLARVQEGCVWLDLRTVLPEDEESLVRRMLGCVV
jgi:L-seryl-tRNA(Ser) seleniumtransferase